MPTRVGKKQKRSSEQQFLGSLEREAFITLAITWRLFLVSDSKKIGTSEMRFDLKEENLLHCTFSGNPGVNIMIIEER